VSISVNFPISVNRNSGIFSLSEQKNGSKNEILVDLSLPLISMSFWDSSQQSARLSRNVCVRCRNIHREMNCARCAACQSAKTCKDSFWMARRIKSYKAFYEPLFEQFRYSQIIRGRIDDLCNFLGRRVLDPFQIFVYRNSEFYSD
jgi:hypothetical protein